MLPVKVLVAVPVTESAPVVLVLVTARLDVVAVPDTMRLLVDAVPVTVSDEEARSVPMVEEPMIAMLAVKLVVAVRLPKVALPVLMPAGVPHPKAPEASVYWTKDEPAQSPRPV